MFSEEMDEAAEHVHERLMDNIFLTSKSSRLYFNTIHYFNILCRFSLSQSLHYRVEEDQARITGSCK
ncbi:hypothetical protein LMH73_023210 [Vibrio splendidus]